MNHYTTTQLAKPYQLTARDLNRLLLNERIIFKDEQGRYRLATQHTKKGYEKVFVVPFTHSDGTPDESHTLKWTETGKLFIEHTLERLGFMKGV